MPCYSKTRFHLVVSAWFVLAIFGFNVSAVSANDEPDQLSWEFFSMNQTLIHDFFEWAENHPPPSADIPEIPSSYQYTWIKASELETDNKAWRREEFGETAILRGPGGHNFRDRGNAYVKIEADGDYRMWVRFQHTKGKNETFTLSVSPAEKTWVDVFNQQFGRSTSFGRVHDPIPGISTVETPEGGFFWEASHKIAHMQKGRYRLRFSGGQFHNRPDVRISDIVFSSDPLYTPDEAEMPDKSTSGVKPASRELVDHWNVFCIRPGALAPGSIDSELQAYWNSWRDQLIDKLAELEYTDYEWGYLASLAYFDEESNLLGRAAEIKTQKELDARRGATFKINGNEFKKSDPERNSWKHRAFYARSYGARENIEGPAFPSEDTAYIDVDIPEDGRYVVWIEHFHCDNFKTSPAEISIISDDDVRTRFVTVRPSGCGKTWTNGGNVILEKGQNRIQLKTAKPEFEDWIDDNGGPAIVRVVLTHRVEFIPSREVEYPDGKRIGENDTAFWFSNDPWAGVTRYSQPGNFYYTPYAPVKWDYLPENEINKNEFSFAAMNGEVSSQLFILRNNTEKPITFVPRLESEGVPSSMRVLTYVLTARGFWSPMLLLERETVTAPPQQNTGLWLSFDFRDVAEGKYSGILDVAGHKVDLKMSVNGSLEGAPVPYIHTWSAPYATKSSWEAYQDLGINMINFSGLTKAGMEKYGILNQVGIPAAAESEESVIKGVEMAENLGLEPGDYSWYLIDEPSSGVWQRWLEMAKNIRNVDPDLMIWCNLGEGRPNKKHMDLLLEKMDYWDISCPYFTQFGVNRRDSDYDVYVKKLSEVGKIRMLYTTPCIGSTEKLFWTPRDILAVGKRAMNHNRNGWGFFSLRYGPPYDDVYTPNQDHAVSIYPGSGGTTIHTRNSEAVRESIQRWRRVKLEEINYEVF